MNVVERCIMGPSPQACRCFWSSSGECRWAALIVFKDGAEGKTERWRGGERGGRPAGLLEKVRLKVKRQKK